MNLHQLISDNAHKLNENELEILDYCVKNSNYVIQGKISEIAETLYTSPASLVRFCQKLGFNGFAEFKAALKMENSLSPEIPIVVAQDFFNDIQTTIRLIDEKQLENFIDLIHEKKRVDIYAVGSTRMVANQIAKNFQSIGIHAFSFDDSSAMNISANCLEKDDLVIGISISGETNLTINSCAIAKSKGCTILSITNLGNNTLSRLADHNLFVLSTVFKIKTMKIQSRMELLMLGEYMFFRYLEKYNNM